MSNIHSNFALLPKFLMAYYRPEDTFLLRILYLFQSFDIILEQWKQLHWWPVNFA